MSFFRRAALIAMIVALVLPQAFFRDCCCSRRTAQERVNKSSVRPCCQARMALAAKDAQPRRDSRPAVKYPPCRCRTTLATLAVLDSKPRLSSGSSWELDVSHVVADSISQLASLSQSERFTAQNRHQAGPPLRKLLCRWVI